MCWPMMHLLLPWSARRKYALWSGKKLSVCTSHIDGTISEENTDPILVEDPSGKYVAVFDPLDGSSNIDANISIGTIFGIYHRTTPQGEKPTLEDVLQPGNKLVSWLNTFPHAEC